LKHTYKLDTTNVYYYFSFFAEFHISSNPTLIGLTGDKKEAKPT